MRAYFVISIFFLVLGLTAFTGCDGTGIRGGQDVSTDGGPGLLPNDPPTYPNPMEEIGDKEKDDLGEKGSGSNEESAPGNGGGGQSGGEGQQPVPEPSTIVLVGSGIALITLCRKKKKQSPQ